MKQKILSVITAIFLISPAMVMMSEKKAVAAEGITIPIGMTYSSSYWWRGVELNNKGVGVFWPSVGLEIGDTGLSLSVAMGVNEDYLVAGNEDDRKAVDDLHEYDYGAAYSKDIGMISLGVGVMYVSYPHADYGSFLEGSLSVGIDTLLSPTIDFYYDYYTEENEDDTNNPQGEDYYIKLSVGHDIISADAFSCSIGSWLGYYNDPYFGAIGFSDFGLNLGFAYEYKKTSFNAGLYYARSLKSDFYGPFDPDGDGTGTQKNHFWADFGVSYAL